jgi:hypothetical protein
MKSIEKKRDRAINIECFEADTTKMYGLDTTSHLPTLAFYR